MNMLLASCLIAGMMNARIRFEDSDAVCQAGRSMCLATEVVQTSGSHLVIEPGDLCRFQPSSPDGRVFAAEGSVSGCALVNMKELAWNFVLAEAGEYEVWMRALFPLAAGYNHTESMDGGEAARFVDSADGGKVDKFSELPGGDAMKGKWLEPNLWHWYLNTSYVLSAGRHRYEFPSNFAWCGGCILDRIVLVKKGSGIKAENATLDNRRVARRKSGTVISRRIKTERIAKGTFEADMDAGGGMISIEYSYDGENWLALEQGAVRSVPADSEYLYIRIRLDAAETGIQPMIRNYRFKVEKRAK